MPEQDEVPWEARCLNAAFQFATVCADLRDTNPYDTPPLKYLVSALMTELWDHFFSQTEITAAFVAALEELPHYAAGEDRRGDRVQPEKLAKRWWQVWKR